MLRIRERLKVVENLMEGALVFRCWLYKNVF